ncbi:MAG: DUF2264 domain-containing protein [Candidatus Dadabacteria bacterium]|nr:DUF2264 domain-containing protein [Candidatus Dadabacteria bacterium]NIQ15259.1 DUF2264 domain-containing protein [Candidatus Dadabacteria bacterium]
MNTREFWIDILVRIANPVFESLSKDKLRETMPYEQSENSDRYKFTHLEAFGRSLSGVGPWINLKECIGNELDKKNKLKDRILNSLKIATDSNSKDYLNFSEGKQPIVDTAFLAQGLLRCWESVWLSLDRELQQNILNCMKLTRNIQVYNNNWLLFAGIIEAFIFKATGNCEEERIALSIRKFNSWYKGDSAYGDGEFFRWNYYNSFVIYPFLFDILNEVGDQKGEWKRIKDVFILRLQRYSEILERFIGPDGSFPPIGRSLTYRFGVFHALSLAVLKGLLPKGLEPGAVRCALTAVIKKMISSNDTFDDNGWLRPGFSGYQPSIAESYISTGSLYLCLCGMLPLGLPASDPFWSDLDQSWTSKRIWNGEDINFDISINY